METTASVEAATVQIQRRRFTVDDYYRMLAAGILHEDDHVELVDGEIREMSAIDAIHAANVKRLNHLLSLRLAQRFVIGVQDPIRLNEFNEPEPDLSVLRWHDDYYEQHHPTPEDTLLVIEVANSSLVYDRREKLPRYAAAGIPQVWLLDLASRSLEQYANPEHGQYQLRKVLHQGMSVEATTIPELVLTVDQIFGL